MLSYVAILVPDREAGGYAVLFPDLPGCATQGEDVADAYDAAVEALAGHLATMEEYGDPIPAPRSFEAIRADRAIAKEHEFNWADVVSMPVFVRPPHGKPERINVSLDSNRLRTIDAYAERRGMTRSAVLEAGADLLIRQDPVKILHTKVGPVILGRMVGKKAAVATAGETVLTRRHVAQESKKGRAAVTKVRAK